MKTKAPLKLDTPTLFAAQNARLGLINVSDLSLLTGVDIGRLNKYAKSGNLAHYGEYHGKRFFNFEEVINWVWTAGEDNEAKPVVRSTMELTLKKKTCPYYLEQQSDDNGSLRMRIVWKDAIEA